MFDRVTQPFRRRLGAASAALAAIAVLGGCMATEPVRAQAPLPQEARGTAAGAAAGLTYADIADLVTTASTIAVVEVRRQATVERERAPGLAPSDARLFLEARTEVLLTGRSALGEELTFLADRPLRDNGRAPRVRKERFVIFADPVPGRPGQLQLIDPRAMLPADPALIERLRGAIAAFAGADVPPIVTGVRDVISVPGNLAGESETQMFIETRSGAPATLGVVRRPGMAPDWGVSWGEVVDPSARPPEPGTPAWYRLACSLPPTIRTDAHLQEGNAARLQAEADYRFVLDQLGPCERTRG